MPSREFLWFQEMAARLADRYAFQWIAVDGSKIGKDWGAFTSIVIGNGDSLGEVVEIALRRNLKPLDLFYVFIRPRADDHTRQAGD